MRIARGWPVVVAYLAVTLGLSLPIAVGDLVHEPTARDAATTTAVGALATVAMLTASSMQRHVGADLARVRAWSVLPSPEPPPRAVHGAWRDALNKLAFAAALVLLGTMRADLATGTTGAAAAASWTFAAWIWAWALVVAVLGVLWPLRLRRALLAPPQRVDVVGWTRVGRALNRPPVWLVVAPAGATRLADLVAIPLRHRADPPPSFAGPIWVHGRLRPGRVAVVRSPDGGAYWPRGMCWGPLPLAFRWIDAQPGE